MIIHSNMDNIPVIKSSEHMADGEVEDEAAYADAAADAEFGAASTLATDPLNNRKFIAVEHIETPHRFLMVGLRVQGVVP